MSSHADVSDRCQVRCLHPEEVDRARAGLPTYDELEQATGFFAMLADPTRARIMQALSTVPQLCVCDLAATVEMSESSVSHQLRLLRTYRLVSRERVGRIAYYRLTDEHVRHVLLDGLRHASERLGVPQGVPA